MSGYPSPCIGVCKFNRKGAVEKHCIGCSMTKSQKKMWKGLKKKSAQAAFLDFLRNQQEAMGKYGHWLRAYMRRAEKKGATPPF